MTIVDTGVSGTEVRGLRNAIENLFTQHCGAVALDLVPPARARWQSQFEPRLATLKKYVDILSDLIPESDVRHAFKTEAGRRMISRRN